MNNIRENMEDKTYPTCANDEGNKNQCFGDTIDSIDTAVPHVANSKLFLKEFEISNHRYFQRQPRPATASPFKTPPPKPLKQSLDGKISVSISEQNFGRRNMDKSPSQDAQHEKFESPDPISMIMRNSSAKQSTSSRSSSTQTRVATTTTNGSSTSTSSVFDHNLLMKSAKSTQSLVLPPISYDHLDRNGPPFLSENGYRFNVCHESFFSQNELLKYFPEQKLRVSVITWNMNSRPPTDYDKSLRELFHLKPFQPDQFNQEHLPEMFVLGLQEAPFSVEIIDTMKIGIQSVLGPNYALLQWSNVGVLHCSVWLRRELLWSCTTVQMIPIHSRHIAANRIRTKGAIALSFGLFGTLFLFINTHLNAHENKLQARMKQLEKMEQTLNLNLDHDYIDFDRAKQNQHHHKTSSDTNQRFASKKHRHRQQHNQLADNLKCQDRDWDVVFWFGDLNFRLELPIDVVLDTIRKINRADKPENRERYLKKLIDSDQLTNLMQRGMIFKNFQEAQWPPSFLPTYKCRTDVLPYRPDTDEEHEISVSDLKQIDNVRNSNSESFSSGSILSTSTASTTTGQSKNVSDSVDDKTVAEATATARQSQLEQDQQFFKTYDIRSGRVPSFTDRILFSKCKTGGTRPGMVDSGRFSPNQDQQTKCLYYNSVTNLKCSDHKPVYALFEVTLDSVGPRNPSPIKRLSRMVDDMNGLIRSTNDADEAKQGYPSASDNVPASDSEYKAEEKKSKSSKNKLRKMIRRNFWAFRKPNRISISSINPVGLGLLPKGLSRSSKVLDSQNLVTKNNNSINHIVSDSSVCLGRLGQFNAGAFDRETYLKGMQLRNRSINKSMDQSLSMEEIKKLSKKPKHHASLYRHQIPLVKSVSLESVINHSANMPKDDQLIPLLSEPEQTLQNHEQQPLSVIQQTDPANVKPETYENFAFMQPANKMIHRDQEPMTNQANKVASKASFKRNQNRVDNANFCKIL